MVFRANVAQKCSIRVRSRRLDMVPASRSVKACCVGVNFGKDWRLFLQLREATLARMSQRKTTIHFHLVECRVRDIHQITHALVYSQTWNLLCVGFRYVRDIAIADQDSSPVGYIGLFSQVNAIVMSVACR